MADCCGRVVRGAIHVVARQSAARATDSVVRAGRGDALVASDALVQRRSWRFAGSRGVLRVPGTACARHGESNWLNTLPRATEADVATIESYLLAHAVQEDLVGAQRRAMAVGLIRRAPTHTLGGPFLGDGFVIVNGSFPGVGSVMFRIEKDREPELYPPLAELAALQVKLRRLLAAR